MSASRLLVVLLLLQQRGRLTAPVLANELEVSVRTVHRDLEALAQAGVPVVAHRGAHGGFELLDSWQARLAGLDGAEAQALPLLGLPGVAAALGVSRHRERAILKLETALGPTARDAFVASFNELHIDNPLPGQGEDTVRFVALAVRRRRELHGKPFASPLHPLGLVISAGTWHLVFATAGEIGSLPLADLAELTTTGARFERPVGFNLANWWASNAHSVAGP